MQESSLNEGHLLPDPAPLCPVRGLQYTWGGKVV